MEIDKIKSLVELFFEKYKEKKSPTKQLFLKWLKNDENNFLIVSRLVRHKNIDLIIKSFNDLNKQDFLEFKLNIIGEGPEYKNIKNLIAINIKLKKFIIFY